MTDSEVLNAKIKELIERQEWAELRPLIARLPAPDIAAFMPAAEKRERMLLFRLLPKQLAAEAP